MKTKRLNMITKEVETIDIYDLAHCDRKSFYGKAKIIETKNAYYLLSYTTIVCKWTKNADPAKKYSVENFTRFWNEDSATTTRHINAFLQDMGCWSAKVGGVKWWRKQEVKPEDSFVADFMYKYRFA